MNDELAAIRKLADGAAELHGLEVWDVQYARGGKGAWLLRVFIDRPNGGVSVEDCEAVSKDLSVRLDVDDVIPHRFVLEVSSPGITRALTDTRHWTRSVGARCRVVLADGVVEGRLIGFEDGRARMVTPGGEVTFAIADVKRANLVYEERSEQEK